MARIPADEDLTSVVSEAMSTDLNAVLVFNVLRTHSYLSPFLDADLRRRRLTASQFNTLLVLRAAGPDGLRMGEIGERLVVTKSNVTGLVDRLERDGLVRRGAHADRRATVVRLTKAGAGLLDRTIPSHVELISELTDCLTTAEKKQLVRLLSKLRRELRRRRKEER